MVDPQPLGVDVSVQHAQPLVALGLRAALAHMPHVRLLEPGDPGVLQHRHVAITDWLHGLQLLSQQGPRVLIVSTQAREQPLLLALRRGLHGLLLASCSEQELHTAVEALAAGRAYVCRDVAQRMAANFSRQPLTVREAEVLPLLARGLCNKSIAVRLGIAPGTAKSHVQAILDKLNASTRTEAARIANELGLVGEAEYDPQDALAAA